MIDQQLKVWVIGVQTGPDWQSEHKHSNKAEREVFKSILQDTFRIVNITKKSKHFKWSIFYGSETQANQ